MFRHLAASFCLAAVIAAPVQAGEKLTFLIDWLPAGDKAAVYVGVDKGLFAAEGLDVAIRSGRGSSDVVTKLATGTADIGMGGLAALLQAKAGADIPVTAVYSLYTVQPDAIFTTDGSGITSLQDLVGKKVATASFSSSNVTWPLILEANGIDPAKIDLLKVDPGTLAPLLAMGQVAATISWMTTTPGFDHALGETKKKLKVIGWAQYGFDGYGETIFATDKLIKDHPDTVRKFLSAFHKANAMAIADPALAAASLKTLVPETDPAIAEATWKASIPLMDNAIATKDGAGAFEPALLAETWKWVAKAQKLPLDKIDPEKAVDRSFAGR